MPTVHPERRTATKRPGSLRGNSFAVPILASVTLVATLILVYANCRTVSSSNFMLTRAFLDPTSRWIGMLGFAVFGCLLVACEAKTGTFFSCCLVVPMAISLEALVIDNYGITHVAWTLIFFIVGSTYIVTCVRLPRLSIVYFLVAVAFFVAWSLRVGDGIVSVLQLSTVGMLMFGITVHIFRAYARQIESRSSPSCGASSSQPFDSPVFHYAPLRAMEVEPPVRASARGISRAATASKRAA